MTACEHINFTELDKSMQLEILRWRNHKNIRENMFNCDIISEQEHYNFLTSLAHSNDKQYFLVKRCNLPIGVIYVTNICKLKHAEGGLYANPYYIGKKVGKDLMLSLLSISKDNIRLEKLYLTVKKTNFRALKLYEKFGFLMEEDREDYFVMGKVLL